MHHWQDYVFATGLFAFTIALIPSIRSKDKPALFTSILTSSFMFIFAITYTTLDLWTSAVAQLTGATAWAILGIQKYRQMRQAPKQ